MDEKPLFVEPGIKTGMAVLVDNPLEVGADRIVNGVAAFEKYGGPCIVVDFGTATTFDVISAKGEYLGGAIAPGIGISAEALFSRAARLPRVEIKDPGKDYRHATPLQQMQAGLYYGTIDMVDGMLSRMKNELGAPLKVVATGGLAGLIAERVETHRAHRRISHARRLAHYLGAQSDRRGRDALAQSLALRAVRSGKAISVHRVSPNALGKLRATGLHGTFQLLQLFHRDRGVFLAEARRASAGLAARLGDR